MSISRLITSASLATLVAAAASAGCSASEPLGPPSSDELADIGVGAVPAYAATLTSTIFMCETMGDGECNPAVEESWFTIELQAAVDVSGEDTVVLPCTVSGRGPDKTFEYPVESIRRVPSGAAQAALNGDSLDLRLSFPLGFELDDPFGGDVPTSKRDERVADHDGDGKPGMTFNTWGPGSVQFGARVVVELTGVDATAETTEADSKLLALDYAILDDSIPLVNVANKVDKYLANHKQSREEASASLTVIDVASCADVDVALR